jgi:phosphoserine phosphatase RsbU/P
MQSPVPDRILIIDDDPMVLSMLTECLESCGHEVLVASDGIQGLELAKTKPVCLVLCDVVMPGMNGYEVAERVKTFESLGKTTFVVMSGFAEEKRERCFADQFLPKPFLLSEVLEIVSNALRLNRGSEPLAA